MTKLKIGVQLFTLRKYLKSPKDVPAVFEKVKTMGADVVQVSGMCKIDAKELKKISDDYALPVCITHVSYDRLIRELPALVEEHKILGCNNIGIGMMPSEFRGKDLGEIQRFCDFLSSTAEALAANDMTMNYHNHNFEFKKVNKQTIYDYMLQNTDKRVQFIPDTFWIKEAGANPELYINKLSGRVNTVHLKDYLRIGPLGIMKPIGDGTLDFKKILAVSEAAKAQNAVVELDFSKEPYAALEKSLEYIKSIY